MTYELQITIRRNSKEELSRDYLLVAQFLEDLKQRRTPSGSAAVAAAESIIQRPT